MELFFFYFCPPETKVTRMNYLFSIIFLLSSFLTFAQTPKIDSLLTDFKTTKQDTTKANDLNLIAREYFKARDINHMLQYASRADSISTHINYKKGKCAALNNKGIAFYSSGDYSKALEHHSAALKLAQEINNLRDIAGSYNGIANVYNYQGEFDKALENHFNALKIREETRDKKDIAASLNGIGNVYQSQGLYTKALEYHLRSLGLKEEIGDVMGQVFSNTNIGNVFLMQEQPEKALGYYKKSLELLGSTKNPEAESTILSNIGLVYQNLHKITESLIYYEKSLKIRENTGNKQGIAQCLLNIGSDYDLIGENEKALQYFQSALDVSKEIEDEFAVSTVEANLGLTCLKLNRLPEAEKLLLSGYGKGMKIGALTVVKDAAGSLSRLYKQKGDFAKAMEYQDKYFNTRDSLLSDENKKKNFQTELNYKFEKKAVADSIKASEEKKAVVVQLEQEKTMRVTLFAGLTLVIVFSVFIYNRFRITSRQKKIIEAKEQETTLQKHIIEEKHKEITDSINYAERIQRSFLATKELLDKNLDDYFVLFKPKDVVSGDFYWATEMSGNRFGFVTADSTGHGVPGAIMSLLNITSLERATEQHSNPAEILYHTRKAIIDRLKKDGSAEGGKDGMDCSLMILDRMNMNVQIAAANNPVWIIRNKTLIEIKPDKMPVGKHDRDTEPFTLHTVDLQKHDMIYAITDGFPDQFGGEKGKKFMVKKLRELLSDLSEKPLQEQRAQLESTLHSWIGGLEQIDDITIVGIRV
jgi:serine phosphatase RsbU (regulator of sigma subunit)